MLALDRQTLINPLIVALTVVVLTGLAWVGRQLVVAAFRVVKSINAIAAAVEMAATTAAHDRTRIDDLEDVAEETRLHVAVIRQRFTDHESWHERRTAPGFPPVPG